MYPFLYEIFQISNMYVWKWIIVLLYLVPMDWGAGRNEVLLLLKILLKKKCHEMCLNMSIS